MSFPARASALVAVIVVVCACSDDSFRRPSAATSGARSPSAAVMRDDPSPSPSPTPDLLLPNMSSLPAEDVHIEVLDDGTRLLRFASVLSNTGPGPLMVVTDDSPNECRRGQRFASQIMFVDAREDGRYSRSKDKQHVRSPAGCMLDHPSHDHWHFDASASYVLTARGSWQPVVSSDKVSFCLRDSRKLPGPGPAQEQYGDCDQASRQGISPGWGDVYESDLDGQALELPDDLRNGRYCLTLTADPFNLWRETDDTDNSSVVGVRINRDAASVVSTTC